MKHSGRTVVSAMLAVVVSFAASLMYSQFRLRPVNQEALSVIDDAAPSIEHLSAVRTELTRMGMYVTEYVARLGDGRTTSRANIDAVRYELQLELQKYRELPSFPGEHQLLAEVDRHLASLDDSIKTALDETDAGGVATAKSTLSAAVHPQLLETDGALARLKTLNASAAGMNAKGILSATGDAAFFATVLGTISLLVAVVATLHVIAVLRRRERLVEEHAELQAERAAELEAFAGRVAHDLKNPVAAMALRVASMTRARDLDPKQRDDLDRTGRLVERMHHIIDGLLEFARAGANPATGAHADLAEVLDEVLSSVRLSADAASAEVTVERFPPTQLACTPAALSSLLSNLLENAVKYIVDGKQLPRRITVRVSPRERTAQIEVEDNGPGLPPGSEQRVFEPFRRVTESRQPGIGLGLATVKKIVEAYGGRVGARSRPAGGSTFWFEMPKARQPACSSSEGSGLHALQELIGQNGRTSARTRSEP